MCETWVFLWNIPNANDAVNLECIHTQTHLVSAGIVNTEHSKQQSTV